MRALFVATGLALASCSPVTIVICGPSNCMGCCDSNDLCQRGDTTLACGARGGLCGQCSGGTSCESGECRSISGVGGGSTSGGSAAGGSATAGGAAGGSVTAGGAAAGGSAGGSAGGTVTAGGSAGGSVTAGGSAGGSSTVGGGSAGGSTAGGTAGGGTILRCMAQMLPCTPQQMTTALNLSMTPAPTGLVGTSSSNGIFTSTIDARAGGVAGTNSGVYVRFTRNGLAQASVSDVSALRSLDWDVSFKRAVIRLNGGDSGPSCVDASRVAGTPALSMVPPPSMNSRFSSEDILNAQCDVNPDSSGTGQPATVMREWFRYASCVQTTGAVWVIRTANADLVAFTVDQYYSSALTQQGCNSTGLVGPSASAAEFTVRWRFLN